MLDISVIGQANIVTSDFGGSLDVDDEQRLRSALDPVIERHGQARVLASIGEIDVGRVEPKAAWMDLKAAGYFSKIDRLAAVSDASWFTRISDWTGERTSLTVQTYSSDQRDQSIAWLSQL